MYTFTLDPNISPSTMPLSTTYISFYIRSYVSTQVFSETTKGRSTPPRAQTLKRPGPTCQAGDETARVLRGKETTERTLWRASTESERVVQR